MEPVPLDVRMQDGRSLEVLVAGSVGEPLVFHHGTPMSKVQFEPWAEAVVARGHRFVTYARPGYARSTREADRTVASCAGDVEAILDALGADRCVTLGWSGGGPHALATGALLPDRTAAVATIAGVGPFSADDLDFLAGMGEWNIREFGLAVAREEPALTAMMRDYADEAAGGTIEDVVRELGSILPPVDVEALTGAFAAFFLDSGRDAFLEGIWGWYDDDLAFASPWGFQVEALTVPVSIWQGEQDLMVPIEHGRWLAEHVAGATAHLLPEHGHASLALGCFEAIVDDLVSALSA